MKTLKQWYMELFPYINKSESVGTRNKDLLRWLDLTEQKLLKKHNTKLKRSHHKFN